jgi:hypothetical protein
VVEQLDYLPLWLRALDQPNYQAANALARGIPQPKLTFFGVPQVYWLAAPRYSPGINALRTSFEVSMFRRCAATLLALRLYQIDHGGALPKTLAPLVPAYLDAVPLDPMAPLAPSPAKIKFSWAGGMPFVYSVSGNGIDDAAAGILPLRKNQASVMGTDFCMFYDIHAGPSSQPTSAPSSAPGLPPATTGSPAPSRG